MTSDYKIRLYVQPLPAKGQLVIKDANGQLLYQAAVALQKGLSQQFDLASLSAGTYQLTLILDEQILSRTFVLQAKPNQSYLMQKS